MASGPPGLRPCPCSVSVSEGLVEAGDKTHSQVSGLTKNVPTDRKLLLKTETACYSEGRMKRPHSNHSSSKKTPVNPGSLFWKTIAVWY